jgi:hypothetical protein
VVNGRTYSIFGVLTKQNAFVWVLVFGLETLDRGSLLDHILILTLRPEAITYRVKFGSIIYDVVLHQDEWFDV